jgi:hypothetical protein
MPVRYMEKFYDASYVNMRRVCRHKLISIFRQNPELLEKVVEESEKDKDFKYQWNYL